MARGRRAACSGQISRDIEKVKPDEMDERRKDKERLP
jgi:hypothetical protein